jgi:hypothetical protein
MLADDSAQLSTKTSKSREKVFVQENKQFRHESEHTTSASGLSGCLILLRSLSDANGKRILIQLHTRIFSTDFCGK